VGYAHGGELWEHCADGREAAGEIDQASGASGLAHPIRERESQPGGVLIQGGRRAIDSSKGLDDAHSCGCDRHHGGHKTCPEPASGYTKSWRRAVESRLGRVLDGVSDRLDEVAWPAWRGQEQRPWEPPRTVRGLPERPRRIESLGLAVVPWQAYPIFALIKEMDDILKEKGATLHGTHQNQPT